jgi:7tm Chemosensory receptor
MLKGLHRFALTTFNFASILNLEYRDGIFEVSKFTAISNVLKLPAFVLFRKLVSLIEPDDIEREQAIAENLSSFFRLLQPIFILVCMSSIIIIFVLQCYKRDEIKTLANQAMSISLNEELRKKLEADFIKFSGALIFIFVASFMITFAGGEASLSMLSNILLVEYNTLMLICFIVFVKLFELLLTAAIYTLKAHLAEFNNFTCSVHGKMYLKLSKDYQQIYLLSEQFNNCFGLQITLVLSTFFMCVVLNVSTQIRKNRKMNFIFLSFPGYLLSSIFLQDC